MKRPLSRRAVLRGLGGIAVSLPFLDAMTAFGQTTAPTPRRFVFVFTANGTIPPNWTPTGTETNFTFGSILDPLTPFKSKLMVLDNVDMESSYHGPGDGHQKGMGHLLTGTELLQGTQFTGGGNSGTAGWGGGISVDQEIAKAVGAKTKIPSLVVGVRATDNTVWGRLSYAGPDMPLPPENSPANLFNRLFSDFNADALELERLRAQRKSVLDTVKADFQSLNPKLGAQDRVRLDAHLTAIREIEKRLDFSGGGAGPACTKPSAPPSMNYTAETNYPTVGKLQMDLITMALACDLTRVVTLQWHKSVSQQSFPWLGFTERHHDLSHEGDSNGAAQDKLTKINRWYAEQFAYFLGQLDGITEGTGTLLDHSAVVWGNELGKGNTHTRRDVPFVLAGSCGGYFRTGRYVNCGGKWHNNLWVSMINAMGIPATTFGNPAYCTGAMPNLT